MTCKYNEAVALNTDEVAAWVKRNRVITLKADFTNDNPVIAEALVELGNTGTGIPFYAIYPKGGGAPITFDGIVTQGQVLENLAKAAGLAAPE